jgi:hypothetical protein
MLYDLSIIGDKDWYKWGAGIGAEAQSNDIDGKINWIGIGPDKKLARGKRRADWRGPLITFEHFRDFGTRGPDFRKEAKTLAERMYDRKARHLMVDESCGEEYREARAILRRAEGAPQSSGRVPRQDQPFRRRRCPVRRRTITETCSVARPAAVSRR